MNKRSERGRLRPDPREKIEVTCAFCHGAGKRRGSICPACRGMGKVALYKPTRRCVYCNGAGIQPHSALTCSVCGGVGTVTVEEDSVPCPACGGTGVEPEIFGGSQLPCLICRGKGVISARRAKAISPSKRPPRHRWRGYGSREVTLEY